MYTKESLEELRHRIDLVEVLSPHINLKRAGSSYKAHCPFHDEKTPSFLVQKGERHYHCFGCGAHGDAIQFLMAMLNLSFVEAVDALAEQFHVSLERAEKTDDKAVQTASLREALEQASLFYHYCLMHTQDGKEALHYLFHRGITIDFIRRFEIGFAPAGPHFRKMMQEKKIKTDTLVQCGLLHTKTTRDFFEQRITFPIRNASGGVIGFSARKYREETFGGKYINTPETPLFKKSRILFGLNYCRKRIVKEKRVILVEGQIDCLRMIEAGFNLTVATLGTAFGESHVRELQSLGVRDVFLLFDADEAGGTAASKTGDFLQKVGIEVKVATLPKGDDPDTFLAKYGSEKLITLLEKAQDYLSFQLSFLSRSIDLSSPAGKNNLIEGLCKQVKLWEQPIMVHESLKKIAALTNVPEEFVGVRESYTSKMYVKRSVPAGINTIDPNRILELDLLRWLILGKEKHPHFIKTVQEHLNNEHFWSPVCRALFQSLLKNDSQDLLSLMIETNNEESATTIDEILQKKVNPDKAEVYFIETLQKLLDRQWLQKREEIKIKIHSGSYSENEVLELVKQFDELKKMRPMVTK